MNIKIAVPSYDVLGEGPIWNPKENALYWVDIERKLLQRWDIEKNEREFWELHTNIGSFALRVSGGTVVAMRDGLSFLDLRTGTLTSIYDPEADKLFTRFNDGKCDRQGRFWVGTMDEEAPNKRAALYRFDPDGTCHKMIDRVGISNGLGWSPDNNIFYHTDSRDHTIYAYDFDPHKGLISNRKIFCQTPSDYVPDGLAVDAAGYIWSAKWDGWKVTRYDPLGRIDLEIPLPIQRPTSCVFGGKNLDKLFITSARIGLEAEILAEQPLAGNVFVVQTEVSGLPDPMFAG